jgi:hypothetical protein
LVLRVRVMDESKLKDRLQKAWGVRIEIPPNPDFFESIEPILQENGTLATINERGAITATVDITRRFVKELSKFNLWQELVRETSLQRNKNLLQAALYGVFIIGLLSARGPAAKEFLEERQSNMARARAAKRPRSDFVQEVVSDETEKSRRRNPRLQSTDNGTAADIIDRVNARLAHANVGGLSQSAITKRIKRLRN